MATGAQRCKALDSVLEELDVALDDLGPRDVAPAPELRSRGTGHAGDSRSVGFPADGDPAALELRERLPASLAGPLSSQQGTGLPGVTFFRLPDRCPDAFG